MSNTAAPPSSPPPTTPLGVDLDAVERGMRAATGTDLTEAKEAVVEALLRLAVQKCTGEGSKGEFIFGVTFGQVGKRILAAALRRDRPG
jgi:hypothetical protein